MDLGFSEGLDVLNPNLSILSQELNWMWFGVGLGCNFKSLKFPSLKENVMYRRVIFTQSI